MTVLKADLHYHGSIGFQPYWLKVQGYSNKNLLKEIADAAFSRNIGVLAVTSEEKNIPRGSLHDRLGYIARDTKTLPAEYRAGKLGDNVLVVEKNNKKLYLLNSQTVLMKDNGRDFEHLVVGGNEVPNFKTIRDSLAFGKDNGLIQIAEHPFLLSHGGLGEDNLKKYFREYDAIEGHNSQMRFNNWTRVFPVIGKLTRMVNQKAQIFAVMNDKPWIAVSDGHRIQDAGISHIEFDHGLLRTDNERDFIASLKKVVSLNQFKCIENYINFKGFMDWAAKIKIGMIFHKSEV